MRPGRNRSPRLPWRRDFLIRKVLLPWLILGLVSGGLPPLAASQTPPPERSRRSLIVRTDDVPRPVWVGEEFHGTTPSRIDSLPPEPVEVRVGDPSHRREWAIPFTRQVQVAAGTVDSLIVPPLQRLRLRTEPVPALVEWEGRLLGHTPLIALVPAHGPQSVRFSGAAIETETRIYDGAGRRDSTWVVVLPRAPEAARAQRPSRPSWFAQKEYLLPMGAVIAGIAGVWARQSADRAYDEYLETADRDRMREQYDRARNLDRVAVGFWIGAEALLAAAAWTWLRSGGDDLVRVSASEDQARVGLALDRLWSGRGQTTSAPEEADR